MDNVTLIMLSSTLELKKKWATLHCLVSMGNIPYKSCRNPCSLVFTGVLNLTVTKIMFSKCGNFESLREMATRGVLMFMNVFNLKMTWLVIQNCTKDTIIMCCNCVWKFTHRSLNF